MRIPNLYIPNTQGVQEGLPISLVFWPNYRFDIPAKRLFLKEIMEPYREPFFTIVSELAQADFVAVPFDFFFAEKYAPLYLENAYALAKEAKKKVLLFDYTDFVDRTPKLPSHAVLFRVSAYRHHKRQNEIVMPYFVEDFKTLYGIGPKEKSALLSVGYCGYSRFGSTFRTCKALVKRFIVQCMLRLRGDKHPRTHMRGIFWRQNAFRALRKGHSNNRIIERAFYSRFRQEKLFDPAKNREEYVENLRECDLALSVRGDANASQRFYEALSASRIPLFVDTDCVLPLEEIIPYDEFILRVPSGEVERIGEIVRVWDTATSGDRFLEKEKRAREAFVNHLRLDRYFDTVFDREKSPYKEVLFI
jgi:hypothetical protein